MDSDKLKVLEGATTPKRDSSNQETPKSLTAEKDKSGRSNDNLDLQSVQPRVVTHAASMPAPFAREDRTPSDLSVALSATSDTPSRWNKSHLSLVAHSGEDKDPLGPFDMTIKTERAVRHKYCAKKHEWTQDPILVKLEEKACGEGSQRVVYRMRKRSNTHNSDWGAKWVCKRYINEVDREVYKTDIVMQNTAKEYGEAFDAAGAPRKVDFIFTWLLEMIDREGSPLFCVERYIAGSYEKYNSNCGFVSEESLRNTPQAFSHYTFEKSGQNLLICDIQGVGDLWTDPQIHSLDGKGFGEGNLGMAGIALFFHAHDCNPICRLMKLPSFEHYSKERHEKLSKKFWNECTMIKPLAGGGLLETTYLPPLQHQKSTASDIDIPVVPKDIPKEVTVISKVHAEVAKGHEMGLFPGMDPDPNAALFHYILAAHGGDAAIMFRLARLYSGMPNIVEGLKEVEDLETAHAYCKTSVEHGHTEAKLLLAHQLQQGRGCAKDWVAAAKILEDVYNSDVPEESLDTGLFIDGRLTIGVTMAEMYSHGDPDQKDFKVDYSNAADWYNDAAALAQDRKKGKLAMKYFELAEECYGKVDE